MSWLGCISRVAHKEGMASQSIWDPLLCHQSHWNVCPTLELFVCPGPKQMSSWSGYWCQKVAFGLQQKACAIGYTTDGAHNLLHKKNKQQTYTTKFSSISHPKMFWAFSHFWRCANKLWIGENMTAFWTLLQQMSESAISKTFLDLDLFSKHYGQSQSWALGKQKLHLNISNRYK